ncbi:MAG: glycosyltransferase family 4 protein, partial [Planctomycetota bacterium]|nr:glycosyltransferase family 4 protein [Planctomycetota bacterium]
PLEGAGLAAFEPDVIVAYDGRSPAALRGARVARRTGAPLVLVEEGFSPNGKPIERILRGFGTRAWGSLVQRTTARVVALDPVAAAQSERRGFEKARIVELAAGVDVSAYRPGLASERRVRHRLPEHVLLAIGRMEPGRGIEVLVEAFARTVGQRGDWALALAGEGSLRAALRAHCERLGVSARARWIGPVVEEELPGLLGTATALLVPALDDDVASQKIRRAMACGTPVLASNVDRLRGTVEHDVTGLVVRAGDRDAWVEAISRLASDPARRARWGQAARERAVEGMTWPHVASRFEEILRSVVGESEEDRIRAREPRAGLEGGEGDQDGEQLRSAS